MKITFRPDVHQYEIDGRPVPSVTQVLKSAGLTGSGDFYTPEARDRGTAVHLATQLIDTGLCSIDEFSDAPYFGYVQAWASFKAETKAQIVAVERIVGHQFFGVAGTLDRVVRFGMIEYTLDIKTGGPAPWHSIQTAAYNVLDSAESRGRMVVYLRPDGSWKVSTFNFHQDILKAREVLTKFGGSA